MRDVVSAVGVATAQIVRGVATGPAGPGIARSFMSDGAAVGIVPSRSPVAHRQSAAGLVGAGGTSTHDRYRMRRENRLVKAATLHIAVDFPMRRYMW